MLKLNVAMCQQVSYASKTNVTNVAYSVNDTVIQLNRQLLPIAEWYSELGLFLLDPY